MTAQPTEQNMMSQMKKGVLELCILAIIERGESYPGDIALELKESGMPILEGTLYPLLTRMKKANFLDYRWEESPSGPPRKYFQITNQGAEYLKALKITWSEFTSYVNHVLNPKN